ncbi:tyrosine-protein phosphatase 99A [Ischnura elegans]|uniref:tyrosine-protein phosphatase 99A n=1 Tax=Ischnura elegans TaxID=197161 RepID=UPI001ED8BD3C|nr:tyrosine-protein phosphatase 99A [Ischnura elegans]
MCRHFIMDLLFATYICLLGLHEGNGARVFDVQLDPIDMVFAEAGENVTMACPGVSERSLVASLEWSCRGCAWAGVSGIMVKIAKYVGEFRTMVENQNRMSLRPENFAIQFQPVAAEDSGDYYCLVNNRPKPESVLRLVVQDVPDPPGRPLIMGFTSRMVHLSWAPSLDVHNSPVSHYIIEMRVGEDGEWDVHSGITTPTNETKYQVRGLLPYTVYSFRVIAVNSMGRSRPSKESYYMVTLREVPDGKPLITTAHNTSASSLLISWKPPPRDTIHGEFLGYRISYRPRDKGAEDVKEIYIRDPNVESHTITGLETYTQYLVSLQVFNPEGPGPVTTVLVMTDEGVPSKPMNVTVLRVSSNVIDLAWHEPVQPNGEIDGYRIYYMQCNQTFYRTVRISDSYIEYNLTSLKPYTEYKIWLNAFTRVHDGVNSDPIIQRTDISGPSSPNILNLTCQAEDALFLQWQRPLEFNNSIDYYYVGYRDEKAYIYEEIVISVTPDRMEESIIIPNLTMDTMYEIKVRGASLSIFDPVKIVLGEESEAKKVFVTKDCDKIQYFPVRKNNELSAGMIAGVVCAAFALLLAVIAYILWRKCFHAAYYYLDDPPRAPLPPLVEWDSKSDNNYKPGIPVHMFPKCVAELHADGDIGFSKEYDSIQAAATQDEYTCEHSQHPDNKQKNRYLNILAYDHSRVQLLPVPGQKKSLDYVNANYIDGFMRSRAYIGTQGPLPATFDCFWRMVWEQRVAIIVMITNLVERGRRKCDMYWPKEGSETYGVIQVKLVKEDVLATYTVRTFQIRHLRIKKKKRGFNDRYVYQYHYTNWPDHGTPDHPLPVLSFVKKSSAANPTDAGPIIVHCSAGVGRTGTYIVLDAMLKQIRAKGEVNIFGFLRHIRTQRNYLVQTEEQYIFIHDALLEAIESGETNVNQAYLSRYIHSLMTSVYEDEKGDIMKLLDRQFMQVSLFAPKDFHIMSARKPCNIIKNRSADIIPVEAARVHLTPKPGVDGSDYINATWLQGFHKLKEFIISQHPLDITVYDFWQMVWDQNAQTIVMLSSLDDEEYGCFWPTEEGDIDSDNFKVKFIEKNDHIGYQTRDFTVHSLQDDYELPVRLIQCSNWLDNCSSVVSVFDTINMVQEWHAGFQNGPMIVLDNYGGTEAATFCCLTTLMKQLEFEKHVDVYMYAKLYHNRRPGIWRSQDDYLYLYRAMEALIGTMGNQVAAPTLAPDIYLTINGHVNGYVNNGNGHVNSGNGITRLSPEGMEPSQKIKDSIA